MDVHFFERFLGLGPLIRIYNILFDIARIHVGSFHTFNHFPVYPLILTHFCSGSQRRQGWWTLQEVIILTRFIHDLTGILDVLENFFVLLVVLVTRLFKFLH